MRNKRKRKRRRRSNKMLYVVILMAVLCSWKDIQTAGKFLGQKLEILFENQDRNEVQTKNAVNDVIFSSINKEDIRTEGCLISMNGLSQDGIPTGCEAVSTVSALRYFGINVSPEEFIRSYLQCGNFWKENGVVYGPDPHECFAGDPFEAGSLGCFPEVIVNALWSMKNSQYQGMAEMEIKDVSGTSLSTLAETYVADNIPVIVWVTIDMMPSYEGMEYYLTDGSRYVWHAREHCMVLCGFDQKQYYLMDPLSDGNIVTYDIKNVEERYEEMGCQAVVVYK